MSRVELQLKHFTFVKVNWAAHGLCSFISLVVKPIAEKQRRSPPFMSTAWRVCLGFTDFFCGMLGSVEILPQVCWIFVLEGTDNFLIEYHFGRSLLSAPASWTPPALDGIGMEQYCSIGGHESSVYFEEVISLWENYVALKSALFHINAKGWFRALTNIEVTSSNNSFNHVIINNERLFEVLSQQLLGEVHSGLWVPSTDHVITGLHVSSSLEEKHREQEIQRHQRLETSSEHLQRDQSDHWYTLGTSAASSVFWILLQDAALNLSLILCFFKPCKRFQCSRKAGHIFHNYAFVEKEENGGTKRNAFFKWTHAQSIQFPLPRYLLQCRNHSTKILPLAEMMEED